MISRKPHSRVTPMLLGIFVCIAITSALELRAENRSHAGKGQQQQSQQPQVLRRTVSLPDFINVAGYYIKDTLITYECFDREDNLMRKDTITDPASIYYVSAIKKFSDPAHTYRDKDGTYKPTPTEQIFLRYDRMGTEKWLFIDYAKRKPAVMKEYRQQITSTETMTIAGPEKYQETQVEIRLYKVQAVQ